MLAYILSNVDLAIKDILEFEKYEFREDIEYSDKSTITVARKPIISDDDFVLCKDENETVFFGVCETYKSESSQAEYKITLLQKERFFDRQIFVESEEVIVSIGIEDFIARAIRDNFSASGDPLMDKKYLSASAATHTPVAAKVDAENGVYNLKTYLGNAKEYYSIYTDFDVKNKKMEITVNKRDEKDIPIDIETSDIADYTETYEISVLAKLLVHWKIPDKEDSSGSKTIGGSSKRQFYLLADRTITENMADLDRAAGIVKSIYIETETEAEMLQQVYNEFSSNQYNHKISFNLNKGSRLYPVSRFYVGRKCTIKTKTGIRTSIVTKTAITNTSGTMQLTFGKLKVTLIEKLRGGVTSG